RPPRGVAFASGRTGRSGAVPAATGNGRRSARLAGSGAQIRGRPNRHSRWGRSHAAQLCRAYSAHSAIRGSRRPMNVLYEEDGEFKVGAVLATHSASLQVQSPHGRRSKVKVAQVLLRFEQPSAAQLLAGATEFAAGLDTDFLWQCSGAAEF